MQLLSVTQGQAEFVGAACIHEENVQKAGIAGPHMSIFVQMSLKTLFLLIAAPLGVLLAWCDTDSGRNSEYGDQV